MMHIRPLSASLVVLLARASPSFAFSALKSCHKAFTSSQISTPLSFFFLRSSSSSSSSSALRMMSEADDESTTTMPTVEQAGKDPFMKQLSYAAEICSLLEESSSRNDELASELLRATLSHSDGIRGFFATYLTGEGDDTAADREEIPEPLVGGMLESDMDVLVPLACMNVVMPTAMTSMHTDPDLSANAARTARRGARILEYLKDKDKSVATNCEAILVAATGKGSADEELVKYWTKFFGNYGYEEKQKVGITKAIQGLL